MVMKRNSHICHLLICVPACFIGKSREVGRAVAKVIALALDLDANFFDQPEMLAEPIATLRLLHYEGSESIFLSHVLCLIPF